MTNHSFITFKRNIEPETVANYISDLVRNKFGKHGRIDISDDSKYIEISLEAKQHIGSLYISILSKRKLAFLQGHSEFSSYLQYWLANTLGISLKGIRSDEGVDDKWEPKLEANNYIEWLDLREKWTRELVDGQQTNEEYYKHRQYIRKIVTKNIPKELLTA